MFPSAEIEARRQVIAFIQDLIRIVVDITRFVIQITEAVKSGDQEAAIRIYEKAKEANQKADEMKKQFVRELFSMGPVLSHKEDFYALVSNIGEIVDSIDGAAFRIANFKLDKNTIGYLEDIYEMAKILFDQINALRECIYMMSYNPNQVISSSEKVLEYEAIMDDIYRRLIVEVFHQKYNPIDLFKVMEISTRLENASDTSEKIVDRLVGILLA
jgi:uncharacterized protein Yka (UPF0111/DUF47 family)